MHTLGNAYENPAATILVIDEDEELLTRARLALEDQGYIVRTALPGPLALVTVEGRRPDVIVLDPDTRAGFDWQLLYALRLSSATERTPVLVTTRRLEQLSAIMRGVAVDHLETLAKPYDPEALVSAVRGLLRQMQANGR